MKQSKIQHYSNSKIILKNKKQMDIKSIISLKNKGI